MRISKGFFASEVVNLSVPADLIIKNTYRTLMTRGMKGCYIYCTDEETARYFRTRLTATEMLSASVAD